MADVYEDTALFLQRRVLDLQTRLAEYEDAHRMTVDDCGAADEQHCSCVPSLRLELQRTQAREKLYSDMLDNRVAELIAADMRLADLEKQLESKCDCDSRLSKLDAHRLDQVEKYQNRAHAAEARLAECESDGEDMRQVRLKLYEERDKYKARLAEAEQDAARYRWIRNMCEVTCLGTFIESDADVDAYIASYLATDSASTGEIEAHG